MNFVPIRGLICATDVFVDLISCSMNSSFSLGQDVYKETDVPQHHRWPNNDLKTPSQNSHIPFTV
jgi:hypothetical protein